MADGARKSLQARTRRAESKEEHPEYRCASVYLSPAECVFLAQLPGRLGWSAAVRRVLRDVMAFFDLPGHIQESLRADMARIGCASERDYLHHLLMQQYARLAAKSGGGS